MRIEIAARLRPFSHQPGSYLILPNTSLRLQIFPVRIKIENLTTSTPEFVGEMAFDIEGPLDDFTIVQDLEKRSIRVWGRSPQGFFRYSLAAAKDNSGVQFTVEKAPQKGVECSWRKGTWQLKGAKHLNEDSTCILTPDYSVSTVPFAMQTYFPTESLSLGSHKEKDWMLVNRRGDFTEIFPIWYHLGQLVPSVIEGKSPLIEECREVIGSRRPEKILRQFRKLFLAGFESMLSPRPCKDNDLGIIPPAFDDDSRLSPLYLLSEGYQLIRSLFIQQKINEIHLLPALPPEFHCGRLINISCEERGRLEIEWTKKTLRRAVFTAEQTQRLSFIFCRQEKKCRLRLGNKDKGILYQNGMDFEFAAGQNYWFDNFE